MSKGLAMALSAVVLVLAFNNCADSNFKAIGGSESQASLGLIVEPEPAETPTPVPGPVVGGVAPNYTPMVIQNFEDRNVGQNAGWGGDRLVVDNAFANSGTRSARVEFRDGMNFYGGATNLPQPVGVGETIWYRVSLFMPITLSLSYGDTSGDGFGWNKFLVLSRLNHESPRMYVQPRSAYKKDFGQTEFQGTGLYINHDGLGSAFCQLQATSYVFPRGRWFALQMSWKVATDNTAHVRVWSDDQFIGECLGAGRVSAGYQVQNFGIGDYWNGGAWIKNGSTGSFWIDDVVVTKQTPNTLDSGGRPYIRPEDFR